MEPGNRSSDYPAEPPNTLPRGQASCRVNSSATEGTPAPTCRNSGRRRLGRWRRFQEEEVIDADRGFVWQATVSLHGIPLIRGFDRLVDGAAEMR